MTTYLFAGGGTAGHVNPLLATADRLRALEPDARVIVLGTREGLERELVPARGYELVTIAKLPFPRRPNAAALRFPGTWRRVVRDVRALLAAREVDVVVGFGGYASAPAYRAAHLEGVPLVIHESNAKPGLANLLGARWSQHIGVSYHSTRMPRGTFVGMPLRPEITQLDRSAEHDAACVRLGLDPSMPTLLVTGGSQGARQLNLAIAEAASDIVDAGWQVLHLTGARQPGAIDVAVPHYVALEYLNAMQDALAAASLVVCRAGSLTVSELMATGLPAVYVPLPYGNGEQGMNAHDHIRSGGAILVDNAEFTAEWVRSALVPLLRDAQRIAAMTAASEFAGHDDGADRMCALIAAARTAGAP